MKQNLADLLISLEDEEEHSFRNKMKLYVSGSLSLSGSVVLEGKKYFIP